MFHGKLLDGKLLEDGSCPVFGIMKYEMFFKLCSMHVLLKHRVTFCFLRFFHPALLQDDAGKTNLP